MADPAPPAPKRTPLYDIHVSLGAKMVPFGGYQMPVTYPRGIAAEHRAVREAVGLFDVSHMGEFEVTGPDRNAFVQRVTCNDVGALRPGQAQYSGILTEHGTFVDDCVIYRFEDRVMMVVNAANIARDWTGVVDRGRGPRGAVRAGRARYAAARGGIPALRQRHRRQRDPARGGPRLDREVRQGCRLHGARGAQAAETGRGATPPGRLQDDGAAGRGAADRKSVG